MAVRAEGVRAVVRHRILPFRKVERRGRDTLACRGRLAPVCRGGGGRASEGLGFQLAEQVTVPDGADPLPMKPNVVDLPAASAPLYGALLTTVEPFDVVRTWHSLHDHRVTCLACAFVERALASSWQDAQPIGVLVLVQVALFVATAIPSGLPDEWQ